MTPRCLRYRRRILEISQQVTALHIAPAFSCIEIVDLIYSNLLSEGDTFIMSKGHGVVAQYVVLEDRGTLTREQLDLYCKPAGILGAHPDKGVPGIEASTGSLGHGLSMAVGMAYAVRHESHRVFCLLSDGECQEGSTWEAALMAANLGLSNLMVFVDYNDFGGLERLSRGAPAFAPLLPKFEAFGWEGCECDGHNYASLSQAVTNASWYGYRISRPHPFVVVAKTIKGKGVSFMEDNPIWHYRSPDAQEYQRAMKELGA